MVRQIKFRVWDKSNKRFVEGPSIFQTRTFLNDVFSQKEYMFQQFTGLLDKNGREIYEGDILQYKSRDPRFSRTVVRWTKEEEDNHPGFVVSDSSSHYGKPEIIGNIFETPDALK